MSQETIKAISKKTQRGSLHLVCTLRSSLLKNFLKLTIQSKGGKFRNLNWVSRSPLGRQLLLSIGNTWECKSLILRESTQRLFASLYKKLLPF